MSLDNGVNVWSKLFEQRNRYSVNDCLSENESTKTVFDLVSLQYLFIFVVAQFNTAFLPLQTAT